MATSENLNGSSQWFQTIDLIKQGCSGAVKLQKCTTTITKSVPVSLLGEVLDRRCNQRRYTFFLLLISF